MTEDEGLRLVQVVGEMETLVQFQFAEARRAFVGLGGFQLRGSFHEFVTPRKKWLQLSASEQAKVFAKFLKTPASL